MSRNWQGQPQYGQPGQGQAPYGQPGQAPYGQPPQQQHQGGGYPAGGGGYGGQPSGGYQPGGGPPGGGQPGGAPPGMNPQVWQWFQAVDADRSGQISANELRQALVNANWSHFNEETCRLMISMFDRDQNGQISVQEFQMLWEYIEQWKGVFQRYDADRSGCIETNELNRAWTEMGYRLSPQLVQMAVRRYDKEGRGGLTLDRFIQACVFLKTLTDTFRAKDTSQQGVIRISYEDFLTMVLLNKI